MGIKTDRNGEATPNARRVSGLQRHARARGERALSLIRASAAELFEQYGYASVTLEAIAANAGVTRQTLYRHFPGKYEIALEYIANAEAASFSAWEALKQCDITKREEVRKWVASFIDHNVARRDLRAYVELASTEPAYRAVMAAHIAEIIALLAPLHPVFSRATAKPDGIEAAKAHLFIATLIERSDFIAIGEEWFAREHLEQIMTDWLIQLTS